MSDNIEDRTWFETRNGRTYAYVSKKILDQRTGRFRTQREYVGTVDPETGRIIPAKKRIPIQTTRTDISAPSLGDVLILHSVACDLGIPDMFESVFGDDAKWVLALAMAQCISNSRNQHPIHTICNTCIPEILNLDIPKDGKIPIDQYMGLEKFRTLSGKMLEKNEKLNLLCIHSDKLDKRSNVRLEPDSSGINLLFVLTDKFLQLGIIPFQNTWDAMIDLTSEIKRMVSKFPQCRLILDPYFININTLPTFLETGADIVTQALKVPEQMNKYLYRHDLKPTSKKDKNGNKYLVNEIQINIIQSSTGISYISSNDAQYSDSKRKLNVFPTLNLKLNTDGCEKIDEKIKHYSSNTGCNNAYQTGMLPLGLVGDLGPLIKIKIESSDNTAVRINEDNLKILKSNIGLSAIISTSLDWNASKDLIERCNLFLSSITNYSHTFHNLDCEDNNWFNRIVDGISTSLFIEMHNILTANKIKIDPNEALHIASNYHLIDINGDKCVTTPDALTTMVLKTFGIDV